MTGIWVSRIRSEALLQLARSPLYSVVFQFASRGRFGKRVYIMGRARKKS